MVQTSCALYAGLALLWPASRHGHGTRAESCGPITLDSTPDSRGLHWFPTHVLSLCEDPSRRPQVFSQPASFLPSALSQSLPFLVCHDLGSSEESKLLNYLP